MILIHASAGKFPLPLGHTCGCGISPAVTPLVVSRQFPGSLPCTSLRYWHDPHHHSTWAFAIFVPETSLWGREVLLSLFLDTGETPRHQKSQRTYLAEQSLETGSQSFFLFCKCSVTASSYSSAPLLSISTSICFANTKPSLGSIARSMCSSPCMLPPPSQTKLCGSHRLLSCMESSISTRCAPIAAGLQLRPVTPTFASFPATRGTTAFFHQSPKAGSGTRVTGVSFSLFWFLRSVTGWPCLIDFISTSIQVILPFSFRDLPSLTAKEQVTCSHMPQTCFASKTSCIPLESSFLKEKNIHL